MFSNHLPPASFSADHGACISLWPAGENKFIIAVTVAMSGSVPVVNVLAFQFTGDIMSRDNVEFVCPQI